MKSVYTVLTVLIIFLILVTIGQSFRIYHRDLEIRRAKAEIDIKNEKIRKMEQDKLAVTASIAVLSKEIKNYEDSLKAERETIQTLFKIIQTHDKNIQKDRDIIMSKSGVELSEYFTNYLKRYSRNNFKEPDLF